jgi:beta-xylosidase
MPSLFFTPQKRLATISLVAALTCTSVQAAPSHSMQGPRPVIWSEFLGLNAQLPWFPEHGYRQQISKLKALNLRWVRLGLHWDRLEPSPGQWHLQELDKLMHVMAEEQLKPLVYLVGSAPFATSAPNGVSNADQYPPINPQLFASSFSYLANRYPQVSAWQVWNEQNIPSFWQPAEDPVHYRNLLETSLEQLSHTQPGAFQVIGGHAYYSQMPVRGGLMLQSLMQQGSLKPERVTAYHPYTQTPEGDVPGSGDFLSNAGTLNQHLRLNGSGPIWATEFGWSSYAGPVEMQPIIGELGQADYMLRRLALMSAMDFDKVFLFTLSDLDARATVRDRSYGLLRLDGSEKPAYGALQRLLQITGPQLTPLIPPAFANAPKGMISIAWQRADGRWLWLFWAQEPGTVRLLRNGQGTLHNPLHGTSRSVRATGGGINVSVSRELQIMLL